MSESNLEELPNTGELNSESHLPGISSVDFTLEPEIIVSSPSASQIHVRALDFKDSSAMGPVPNRAIRWVTYHWKRSDNGEIFLDTPIHTPLLKQVTVTSTVSPWVVYG